MFNSCRVLCESAWFIALVLAGIAGSDLVGQPPKADGPKPKSTVPGSLPDTTLYLVLRTGPKESEKAILETLKRGLEASGAKTTSDPTIRSVSPAFFDEFATLVDRASGNEVTAAKDGLTIRQLPSREAVYELKLPATQVLKKLTVNFIGGNKKDYEPSAPGPKTSLVLTVPGRYAYSPEAGDSPVSYEAIVEELGKKQLTLKDTWPVIDKFFVVTVRGFSGDRQKLFEAIQNGKVVANPFKDVQQGNDLLFAFASLNSSAGKTRKIRINEKNELDIAIETIPERNPKRVWVYLALDEKAMLEARDKYRKFDGTELSAQIRKETPVTAKATATLGPNAPPRWFEIPAMNVSDVDGASGFRRTIQLESLPELARKYPSLWVLQVWEFDDGKPQAIIVEHPKDDRVFVLEQEEVLWQKDLKDAIDRTPSLPKKD